MRIVSAKIGFLIFIVFFSMGGAFAPTIPIPSLTDFSNQDLFESENFDLEAQVLAETSSPLANYLDQLFQAERAFSTSA